MNRAGLFAALAVGICAGALFAVFPALDLTIARAFYNAQSHQFILNAAGKAEYMRRGAMWLAWAFAVPAIMAPILKILRPGQQLLIRGRAMVYLLTTLMMTALLLPSVVFKEHWGRPRPITTTEFSGLHAFRPWWDPRGAERHNGSFFSGEAATAFWLYAPASLAPPAVRPVAYAAVTIFGLATGLLRMAFGGHYASDIIAAGIAAFLVAWFTHGLVYRWKLLRLSDEQIDGRLARLAGVTRKMKSFWLLFALVVLVTTLRLVALHFSVVDLFPDEARYWAWSQAPSFGYFSKPPIIAWIIALAERVCGSSEACLRAPAPLFYAGTALLCYFTARHLYGERTAYWTGLGIVLCTGVVFSARIISTDVPLLFFWSLALLAFTKLVDDHRWRWAVLLGIALGLGLLAKYAMIYFVVSALVAGWIDPAARRLWRERHIWLSVGIAVVIFTPNLIWNFTHDFATFRHTQGNIVGAGLTLDPMASIGFFATQFAVCGPIILTSFLAALSFRNRAKLSSADRLMIAFALPTLVLTTLVALLSSAKANWAAPSAISITILAAAILVRNAQVRWLAGSVALGLAVQVVLIYGDAFADRISVPFLPQPDVYRRTMGWSRIASAVTQLAHSQSARSIAADNHDVVASLLYYTRSDALPIFAFEKGPAPIDQFELDRAWTRAAPEPLLYISDGLPPDRLAKQYATVETLGRLEVPSGPHTARRLWAFRLSGVVAEKSITP